MAPTVSATDVAAITAAVLEKLRQDVTAAVTQALGQRQGNGAPFRRSRSESLGDRQRREQPPAVRKDTDTPPSGRSRSKGAQQQRAGSPRAQRTRGTTPAEVKAKPGTTPTESALLATIEELRGTIHDPRKEIAALRNAGGSQQPQEAGARQKERRAREEEKKDATQRTELAQPLPQQTYASAVQTSTRRGRAHTVVIAKKEPQAAGIPLQLVPEELHRTTEKGGYGAVLPARPTGIAIW